MAGVNRFNACFLYLSFWESNDVPLNLIDFLKHDVSIISIKVAYGARVVCAYVHAVVRFSSDCLSHTSPRLLVWTPDRICHTSPGLLMRPPGRMSRVRRWHPLVSRFLDWHCHGSLISLLFRAGLWHIGKDWNSNIWVLLSKTKQPGSNPYPS